MANDPRRGMIWRAAWLVAVVAMLLMWRACLGGEQHVVQIQFGMDPEYLAGAQVAIDGEVVGTLERRGSRTLVGFRVSEGDHTVEVRREGCRAEPTSVTTGVGRATVVLMAVPDSDYRDGESDCVVRLE